MGISATALERIFEAFEQEADAATRQQAGLGLGLAISRSLVQLSHGLIGASSDGPGRGATFRVELPAAQQLREPAPPSSESVLASPSLRLLLVEDHEDTATALAKFLETAGFVVKRATCAGQALKLLSAESFDGVISDLGLPDISGHDLMRIIRQLWNIPGIALSGYGTEEDIRNSFVAGFGEYLVKPVKIAHLEDTLRHLLRGPDSTENTSPTDALSPA